MKPKLLKNLKKGEFFTLTDKVMYNEEGEVLPHYVRVRDDYERTTKRYWVYKYIDVCDAKLMRGDKIVFTDFSF